MAIESTRRHDRDVAIRVIIDFHLQGVRKSPSLILERQISKTPCFSDFF